MINETWRASSRSGGTECVECRTPDDRATVEVRDSKNPDAGKLTFSADAWQDFREAVRAGEFDL